MSYCPSQDWDRHCRDMEGPQPVGERRKVKSRKEQRCESCYDVIPAGTLHFMQPTVSGDDGLFISPMRLHLDGECKPYIEPDL